MHERIKAIRTHFGLSQADFGNRIGVKQATVAGYENGSRTPLDAVIASICREFGVDETWLRTGVGDPFPKKTRNDELAAFFGNVLSDEPGFKQRLLSVLSRLDESEWALLEHMADKLLAEEQKEKAGP